MTGQRVAAIASSASVAVVLAACGGSRTDGTVREAAVSTPTPVRGAPHTRPRGVVEDCSTRSQASFPGAFSDPDNVVVGPLVLVGAAATPASTVREFGGNKFPALVKAGHRVTLALSRRIRRIVGLGYGPLPQGVELSPRDGHRVVTFIACQPGRAPVTFWSGFVLTRRPACIPLEIYVDGADAPLRAGLPLGRRC
jgi:hypothetical protein